MTQWVALGYHCPTCHDERQQDVLDLRHESGKGYILRLKCVACEDVWTVETWGKPTRLRARE